MHIVPCNFCDDFFSSPSYTTMPSDRVHLLLQQIMCPRIQSVLASAILSELCFVTLDLLTDWHFDFVLGEVLKFCFIFGSFFRFVLFDQLLGFAAICDSFGLSEAYRIVSRGRLRVSLSTRRTPVPPRNPLACVRTPGIALSPFERGLGFT